MPDLVYEPIPELTEADVRAAVARNDPQELLIAVLSAALYSEDREFASGLCIHLAKHEHFNVRANALLGLGHIARIDRKLDKNAVGAVQAGLQDDHEYVRGQAENAKDDFDQYLGWKISDF